MIDRVIDKYLKEEDKDTIQLYRRQIDDTKKLRDRALQDTDDARRKENIRLAAERRIDGLKKRIETIQDRIRRKKEVK